MTEALLLFGGQVFDGSDFLGPCDVLLVDGLVADVGHNLKPPPGTTMRDCSGSTVMPGLVDAHVHLAWAGLERPPATVQESLARAARNARELLAAGVTTVRDTGGPIDVLNETRSLIRASDIPGPDLVHSGLILCAPGGHGTEIPLAVPIARECSGPEAFADAARGQLLAGADLVKVTLNGGSGRLELTDSELAAVVEAAHDAGVAVAAHASVHAAVVQAVQHGVDTIEHGNGLDDALAETMASGGMTLVPTVTIFEEIRTQLEGDQSLLTPELHEQHRVAVEKRLADHRTCLQAARRAGVRIALGTDRVPGGPVVGVVDEALALTRHGFTPAEVLRAATTGSCHALRLTDRGRLQPGLRADIVVIGGDLATDLEGLRCAELVLRNGA